MKQLIYKTSLTARYTVCDHCGAVNSEKLEYVQESLTGENTEVYSCTRCGGVMYGTKEIKSAKLKAVDWYLE